jgi:excisionase family DNA binding protein
MLHSGTPASSTPSCPDLRHEGRRTGILHEIGTLLGSGDEGRGVAQNTAQQLSGDSTGDDHPETSTVRRNGIERGSEQRGIPILLDIEMLANSLGISTRQVRRFVADGRVPFIRIGHLIRFDPEEISEWIEDHRGRSHRRA